MIRIAIVPSAPPGCCCSPLLTGTPPSITDVAGADVDEALDLRHISRKSIRYDCRISLHVAKGEQVGICTGNGFDTRTSSLRVTVFRVRFRSA
jgi:hypothetical protein